MLWVCAAPPESVSAFLAEALTAGVVTSAALVPANIPDELLWVAREWYGAFVVDRALVGLLGDRSGTWADDSGYSTAAFGALILRPARPQPVDPEPRRASAPKNVETASEYAASITDDRPVVASAALAACGERLRTGSASSLILALAGRSRCSRYRG